MSRYALSVFSSYRNSVWVWVVTQGKMQFDTRLPSKSSPMTPEKMKKTVKSGTYWSTTHLPVVEPVVDNFYQVGKLLTTLNDFKSWQQLFYSSYGRATVPKQMNFFGKVPKHFQFRNIYYRFYKALKRAFREKSCNLIFWKWGGVKGRWEFFRKFIRFGTFTRPLPPVHNFSQISIALPNFVWAGIFNNQSINQNRLLLTQYHKVLSSTALYWPSTVKYHPVPPYFDPQPMAVLVSTW